DRDDSLVVHIEPPLKPRRAMQHRALGNPRVRRCAGGYSRGGFLGGASDRVRTCGGGPCDACCANESDSTRTTSGGTSARQQENAHNPHGMSAIGSTLSAAGVSDGASVDSAPCAAGMLMLAPAMDIDTAEYACSATASRTNHINQRRRLGIVILF